MRIIGHLPNEASAATFSDFLYVEGITNLVEPEKEGWAVWIHSEDQLEKARELLSGYVGNPRDPKYRDKSQKVAELKEREQDEAEAAEKRVHDRSHIFRTAFGLGPLTLMLAIICVAVWGLMWLRPDQEFLKALYITKYEVAGNYLKWIPGLPEIRHGEVWRLITPIFIHAWPQPFHLIFNVYALFILGTMIEVREGTLRLGSLVLLIAALSNFAQYYFVAPNFCGISGVVYGLFGYIWMKAKFNPGSGFYLHPQTVMMMLMWFVLCLTRVIPNIANTVHGVGLGVGVAWGFLSSLTVLRARQR